MLRLQLDLQALEELQLRPFDDHLAQIDACQNTLKLLHMQYQFLTTRKW